MKNIEAMRTQVSNENIITAVFRCLQQDQVTEFEYKELFPVAYQEDKTERIILDKSLMLAITSKNNSVYTPLLNQDVFGYLFGKPSNIDHGFFDEYPDAALDEENLVINLNESFKLQLLDLERCIFSALASLKEALSNGNSVEQSFAKVYDSLNVPESESALETTKPWQQLAAFQSCEARIELEADISTAISWLDSELSRIESGELLYD